MNYRDILNQRNVDFQKDISRVKKKLEDRREEVKKIKLEKFKKLKLEEMESAIMQEIRNKHKSFKKELDKARDSMRDTDLFFTDGKFNEFLQNQQHERNQNKNPRGFMFDYHKNSMVKEFKDSFIWRKHIDEIMSQPPYERDSYFIYLKDRKYRNLYTSLGDNYDRK